MVCGLKQIINIRTVLSYMAVMALKIIQLELKYVDMMMRMSLITAIIPNIETMKLELDQTLTHQIKCEVIEVKLI